MARLRVLLVAAGYPTPIGQCHLYFLARRLPKECELDLICFDQNRRIPPRDLQRSCYGDLIEVSMPIRRRIWDVARAIATRTPVLVFTYQSSQMRREIMGQLKRKRYDVVVFEQLAMAQYSDLVVDCPVLLFPVDAVSRLKHQYYEASLGLADRLLRVVDYGLTLRYERRVYQACSNVMFVSDVDAHYTWKSGVGGDTRLHVLPNGVDVEYFVPSGRHQGESRSVVFVGNMGNYINQDAVLWFYREVWPDLRRHYNDLNLYIVGNSPPRAVRCLSLSDPHVIVTGYVLDLRPFVWQAEVFVSPLRLGTGIKNRVLQAMSMGKAIVASPLAAEGIDIRDGEHVLLARTANDYVRCVSELLDKPGKRARLGRAARAVALARYSLEATSARFLEIVSSIVPQQVPHGH